MAKIHPRIDPNLGMCHEAMIAGKIRETKDPVMKGVSQGNQKVPAK
jgi:hypothetical protein